MLLLLILVFFFSLASGAGEAKHGAKDGKKPAILLVTFGTSVASAPVAFTNIEQQVRQAYPDTEIRWAYTSKMIRKKLAKEGKILDSPEIALARLMDEVGERAPELFDSKLPAPVKQSRKPRQPHDAFGPVTLHNN